MKKFINILTIAALALFTAVSCQKEAPQHEPGAPDLEGCYGVYFPAQEAAGDHTYDPEMAPSATFTVARLRSTGSITVPVVVSSSADVFQVENIVFEDGQTETTFDVNFPNAEEGTRYSLHMEVQDPQYASVYNDKPLSLDFSVLRVQWQYFLNPKTGEKALVQFTQNWWGETAWCYIKYYEVNGIRTCFTETVLHDYKGDQYDDPGFWGTGADYEWNFIWYTKNNNSDGNNLIRLSRQNTGYYRSDYEAYVYALDYFYWNASDPNDEAEFLNYAKSNGDVVSYYDGNGGFYLSVRSYYMFGVGGWNPGAYDTVGVAEGFVRTDYSISLESDFSSEGVTPILAIVGADVKKIKYAIYEGSLNAVQIDARATSIANNEEAGVVTVEDIAYSEAQDLYYAYFGVSPEATGTFTLVAVGFDENNGAQEFDSVEFFFVSADDQEEYAVPVSVFTEETPARYELLNPFDSFAYGVSTTGATEVRVGVFAAADITSLDAVLNTLKSSNSYVLAADKVAEANADGGYYNIARGLKARTEYYVVAWATNGALENYAYAAFETEPLPYVWNSIGQGTLTDGLLMPIFGEDDVTVTCDVYEEANTPGLYMVTGFQLQLCALFYGASEEELAPYEGEDGNWFNAPIIVDATDPNAVYIGEQDYGIYVNGTYGYVMIDSEPTGTLVDGVITWPAKEMYVGLTKYGWLYGNTNGTFAITLPESASTAAVTVPAATNRKANFNLVSTNLREEVKYERDPKAINVTKVDLGQPSFEKKSGRDSALVDTL